MLHLDRQAILEAVHQLPPEEQRELAREILQTVARSSTLPAAPRREPPVAPSTHAGSAMSLRGIARTGEPLDDARLLDESRMERYGG